MDFFRFLVIGQSGAFLDRIRGMFEKLAYPAEYVEGIEAGFDRVRSRAFDVLVVDYGAGSPEITAHIAASIESHDAGFLIVVTRDECRDDFLSSVDHRNVICLSGSFDLRELQLALSDLGKIDNLQKEVREAGKRVLQLEVINLIARKSLAGGNEENLLWDLAGLIQEKLGYYNVNIFLMDERGERIVLKAFAGVYSTDQVAGFSLSLGEGISGWVAQHRESLVVNDVTREPRRLRAFSYEDNVYSELAVPISSEGTVYGVLHVESTQRNAFTEQDLLALETVADQMSMVIRNMNLSRALIESKKLTEAINDSLPLSIVVLNSELSIEYVNRTFCETNNIRPEEVIGKRSLESLFSPDFLSKFDLPNELRRVIEYGISISHSNIRHSTHYHPERILNITFKHLKVNEKSRVMVLIQDVTEFTHKMYQLLLLREISLAMQGVLERDKLLHLIMTCVTAGFAIGFNRAFLFLVDDDRKTLRGTMGVGPSSLEEAYQVWDSLSHQSVTLKDYLEQADKADINKGLLQDLVSGMEFDLPSTHNVLTETVATGNYITVTDAWEDVRVDEKLKTLLASKEFVVVPLIMKNEVIGVLMADNAYSGRNISMDSIELLSMLANTAAIAIENAKILRQLEGKVSELEQANTKLQKTQNELIRKEKLAAIGEVSTRLAHEIRNPLSIIGGFAKSIPAKYDNRERTIRNANIIVEEVRRLEQILTNVLDYSKPAIPKKGMTDINGLIKNTLAIMENAIVSRGVIAVTHFDKDPLEADIDAGQIKQVLINVIQNALNSMTEGGAIEIRTDADRDNVRIEFTDTGCGIPGECLETIFEPFFTTWGGGTGLGLAISQMIVQNHGGKITIASQEKVGTTVSIQLPFK